IRVEPDVASLQFAVTRQAAKPRDAFKQTHAAARDVRAFLTQASAGDVAASRVSLSQAFEFVSGHRKPTGYVARAGFNVLLPDLNRLEDILTGAIDAGANEVGAAEFLTSRLKEVRAEARRRAVAAAREKAENYCLAAGVTLGPVLHLEDIHPEALR